MHRVELRYLHPIIECVYPIIIVTVTILSLLLPLLLNTYYTTRRYVVPSAATTAAKWQLLLDPAKSWLVIETRHAEATKASCTLCSKWQEKLRKARNFNDALMRGIEGKALKKDNLEKHELSAQHRDAVCLEKGPQRVSEWNRTTAIGINNYEVYTDPKVGSVVWALRNRKSNCACVVIGRQRTK